MTGELGTSAPAPMGDRLLGVFVREVKIQCDFALLAYGEIRKTLQISVDLVFFSIHAFLTHASNASRLLWPSPKAAQARGEQLRNALKVPAASGLRSRNLRDHFEHFDERLDFWASSSARRNFIDMNIASKGAISGFDVSDVHRNFDPETEELTFRGETLSLSAIRGELIRLREASRNWLTSGIGPTWQPRWP